MAAINYDAIAQELEKQLEHSSEYAKKLGLETDKPMMLKEFYTLGINTPRQSGKTKWLIENLIRYPCSRLITINDSLQEEALHYLSLYRDVDDNNTCPLMPGGRLEIPNDVAQRIRHNGPGIIDHASARILTSKQLKKAIDNDFGFLVEVDRIYIDGRVQIFNKLRYSKYYTWLAKVSDKHILTWLIN